MQHALDRRIRGEGMQATSDMVRLHEELLGMGFGAGSASNKSHGGTYAIVNEGDTIPQDGIEFNVPPEALPKMTKSLLNSIRRLHVNTGHPPNAELERVIRLSISSHLH